MKHYVFTQEEVNWWNKLERFIDYCNCDIFDKIGESYYPVVRGFNAGKIETKYLKELYDDIQLRQPIKKSIEKAIGFSVDFLLEKTEVADQTSNHQATTSIPVDTESTIGEIGLQLDRVITNTTTELTKEDIERILNNRKKRLENLPEDLKVPIFDILDPSGIIRSIMCTPNEEEDTPSQDNTSSRKV